MPTPKQWAENVAIDWFSIAPEYRSEERLVEHLLLWLGQPIKAPILTADEITQLKDKW